MIPYSKYEFVNLPSRMSAKIRGNDSNVEKLIPRFEHVAWMNEVVKSYEHLFSIRPRGRSCTFGSHPSKIDLNVIMPDMANIRGMESQNGLHKKMNDFFAVPYYSPLREVSGAFGRRDRKEPLDQNNYGGPTDLELNPILESVKTTLGVFCDPSLYANRMGLTMDEIPPFKRRVNVQRSYVQMGVGDYSALLGGRFGSWNVNGEDCENPDSTAESGRTGIFPFYHSTHFADFKASFYYRLVSNLGTFTYSRHLTNPSYSIEARMFNTEDSVPLVYVGMDNVYSVVHFSLWKRTNLDVYAWGQYGTVCHFIRDAYDLSATLSNGRITISVSNEKDVGDEICSEVGVSGFPAYEPISMFGEQFTRVGYGVVVFPSACVMTARTNARDLGD